MDTETSPRAIEKRLDALSKWHEEYRVLLNKKRENSNTMNTIEILYPDEKNNLLEKDSSGMLIFDENLEKSPTGRLSKPTSGYVTSESKLEDTDSAQSIFSKKILTHNNEDKTLAPRKFLRKGEGIKQRFKIEADAFNLKKLPPYKYARSHPKLIKRKKQQRQPSTAKEAFKDLEHMPAQPKFTPFALDMQEMQFQRLLFASRTVCNSTPESKGNSVTSTTDKVKGGSNTEISLQIQQSSANSQNSQLQDSSSLGVAWSKVLDPFNIKPISVAKLREQNDTGQNTLNDTDDDNLNLFELLEEKAKEGSFNLNCSLIKRILAKNMGTNEANAQCDRDSDIVPISEELRTAHIEPKVDVREIQSSSESEDESEGSEDEVEGSESESDAEGSIAGSEEAENEHEDETTMVDSNKNDSNQKDTACLRVRFVDEDSNAMQHNSQESKQFEESSLNVDSSALFEQMKSLVLAALAKNENPTESALMSSPPVNAVEIKQLAEQGRQRVAELEKQIALFKETNLQLMKAKQEHELEKVYFMQQQEEALEQINDEKIKFEIQLHDERMKLEQERRKSEEKSRMQKAALASNERKEIAKLKEEIALLQKKLSDKEQNHTAAQARLRSQLRVMEKEQKTLYEEIERLSKENKKLEKQISQQTRERNTTMLSEINRNIVKLAGSSKNHSNTNNNNEKPNSSAKNFAEKQTSGRRTTTKKSDQSNEPLKTLKITANSFRNLLPPNLAENVEDKPKIDNSDDEESMENETLSRHKRLEQSMAFSPKAEKENSLEKTTSSFKVLTREITSEDGGKEIIYPNGTIRKESGDGLTVRMMYFNGDVKETNVKEGTIKYYYSKTNTWHTTYLDGLEIIEFPNGQIEHRLPSGVIEVHYPHKNCVKIMDPKDAEKEAEYVYDDGTKVCEMRNGNKLLILPNGQKELTTKEFKRREYPDGTIKTVYPDGSQETRYSNGRFRLKDKDGNLIIDSEMQPQINVQHQQSLAGFN